MNKFISSIKPKAKENKRGVSGNLMQFVSLQFKQLSKKNLRIPIQLYDL